MLRVLAAAASRISPEVADFLLASSLRIGSPALRSRLRGHERALERLGAAGPGRKAGIRAAQAHARFLYEFLAEIGGRRFPVEVESSGLERPSAAGGRDPGRLIVTMHRGNWIAAGDALAHLVGPITTVAGVQLRAAWQRRISEFLAERGIHAHRGAGAFSALLDALRSGGTAVVHLDGVVDAGASGTGFRGDGARVPWAPIGVRAAALLAARSGAKVYVGVCDRVAPGRFRLRVRPLAPSGTREESVDPVGDGTGMGSTNTTDRPTTMRASIADGRAAAMARTASEGRAQVRGWERVLLAVLRHEVRKAPEEWILFRSDHLGFSTQTYPMTDLSATSAAGDASV